ncbi:MAG: LLM class flavin-dependent oxidoreductase [Chloroflexi bacterium]|nr:LLM class flavin-dependent oxidoreductase [Chloroflexota bacterium]
MDFGLFDWIDESGREIGETYEQRLQVLELADQLGFYCYHLAEHHQTELSTVPSPNLFLAAAAERTRRLRLGPLSVILPLYDPLRLLEEICMLDQLSGGRLELGLSRGSQGEHIQGDPELARAMFNESLQVIVAGLRTGELDFHGTHYSFDHVMTRLRPVQKPYPPLWYPTSNIQSIPYIAAQRFNALFSVHLAPEFDRVASMVRTYRAELESHAPEPTALNAHVEAPRFGFVAHIHVAESDSLAVERARPAYDQFVHNFTYRYFRRGAAERYTNRTNFDRELEAHRVVVGAPATVRAQLADWIDRSGANYVVGCFTFGSLSLADIKDSLQLFASEVMPGLSPALSARSG